jgi:DNA polymerase III epsilon subunit family exonuclease
MHWNEKVLIGLDTETTGLSFEEDRIFEIGLVSVLDGRKVEEWSRLLNPGRPLSAESVEKTGVRDEELASCPSFQEVAQEFLDRIRGQILVGYNLLNFDWPMILAELKRLGLEPPSCWRVDALVLARGLVPQGRHSLKDMVAHFGLTMETAHRATADADAVARLLLAMAPSLPPDLDALLELQAQWAEEFRARKAVWREKRDDRSALLQAEAAPGTTSTDARGRVRLGPGYLYGREPDPLRAFLAQYTARSRTD